MLATLRTTYSRIGSWLVTLGVASITFVVTVVSQQWGNLKTLFALAPDTGTKVNIAWNSLGNFATNLSPIGQVGTILIAILLGLNITLLVSYIKTRRAASGSAAGHSTRSLGGIIAGIFGIGCAACGTALLGAFLSIFGATGLLAILPLHGQELTLLSVAILAWASWKLLQEINKPAVCSIESLRD